MTGAPVAPVLQAVEALKAGERRQAAQLLREELDSGPPSGDRWRSVSRLAGQIGEIDMAIEASRRAASPATLERVLAHCATLAAYGRPDEAMDMIEALPAGARESAPVLHFLGAIAAERGKFELAEDLYRRALRETPAALATWFALAMIKTFRQDDPDLRAMQKLGEGLESASPDQRSRFLYALGKAYDDIGDPDAAFRCFSEGAALRRAAEPFDPKIRAAAAARLIEGFSQESLRALKPSGAGVQRSLFVTGLPRSGTTLVEQILTAHSQVSDGAETNLLRPALIPTVDYTLDGARAYERRHAGSSDPWGEIAADYARFIDMRFREPGLVVDKTLGLSSLMGLLLHALPEARVIWLRRNPEDVALSCFRTFFTSPVPWSWSLEDIAAHLRTEDRFFEHWSAVGGDRILPVPYEQLAAEPAKWTGKILAHLGLEHEAQVESFYDNDRHVQTASVRQVRAPVSTDRVDAAKRYEKQLERFRAAYYEPA